MNSDLISRRAAIEAVTGWDTEATDEELEYVLNDILAVDAEPVRHGRWIHPFDHVVINEFFCSECNKRATSLRPINRLPSGACKADENGNFYYPPSMNYCPDCGAKMDMKEELT